MEERKKRFEDKMKCADGWRSSQETHRQRNFFDGAHIFNPHGDVPDDSALRLVVLTPEQFFSREEPRLAVELRRLCREPRHLTRYRGNRLIFLAPIMVP